MRCAFLQKGVGNWCESHELLKELDEGSVLNGLLLGWLSVETEVLLYAKRCTYW